MNKKLTELKEYIYKELPELQYDSGEPVGSGYLVSESIRLDDVLIAVSEKTDTGYDSTFNQIKNDICVRWAWGKTLDNQSEETKLWLWELLIKE